MSKFKQTFDLVVNGHANANIRFEDLCSLASRLGFKCRIKGSHHIFTKTGIPGMLNLQPGRDGKAMPYQVRQVAGLIAQFNLKPQ